MRFIRHSHAQMQRNCKNVPNIRAFYKQQFTSLVYVTKCAITELSVLIGADFSGRFPCLQAKQSFTERFD